MKNRVPIAAMAAVAGALGWSCSRRTVMPELSVLGVLAVELCFFGLVRLAFPLIERRRMKYALPLGFFFGLCAACGSEMFREDALSLSFLGILGKLLCALSLTAVGAAAVLLVLQGLEKTDRWGRLSPCAVFWLSWGVIFLCWVPCWIAFFPGIMAYDMPTQLRGISEGTLTADHPLFHTLIAWGCYSLGKILHSYTLGAALYSLVQILALSASFGAAVAFLRRQGAPRWVQGGVLAWFALAPVHPLFAVNSTKDVLFAACTVWLALLVAELLLHPERLRSACFWGVFIVSVAVMALMRNTGVYVFALFTPALVLLLPRRRLAASVLCLLCLAGCFGGQKALSSAMQVQKGRVTEMLSVPLQQLARCAYDGVLTPSEQKEVEVFLPQEVWESYQSRLADPVKNEANREAIEAEPLRLVKLWLRLGVKYPARYLSAFLGLNHGYWYPEMEYPDPQMWWHSYIETGPKEISDEIRLTDPDLWPAGRRFYLGVAEGSFQKVPLADLLMKPGLFFWMAVLLGAAAVFYRNPAAGGVAVLLLLSWLLQLLSPIALVRYVYPMMAATPILIGCFYKKPLFS